MVYSTLPAITMEVENEVLEDVFSLQMGNFHFHVYGGKGSSCLSQNLDTGNPKRTGRIDNACLNNSSSLRILLVNDFFECHGEL